MLNIIIEPFKGHQVALYVNGRLIKIGTPTAIVKLATTIRATQDKPTKTTGEI